MSLRPWLVLVCFATRPVLAAEPAPKGETNWIGIYASPAEIGGFSGTVLAVEKGYQDRLEYRMTFYSDVQSADDITESEKHGMLLTDGDKLYVPQAHGYYSDKKPRLLAMIDRYTRREINGRVVLFRDDALKALTERDQLYDYGILIQVADKVERFAKLEDVKHESIKVLYKDPTKPWNDPFVNGPNKR